MVSSGYSLNSILDMSWSQIHLLSECTMHHKMHLLEVFYEPIVSAFGGKNKNKAKKAKQKIKSKLSPEQKDGMLLHGLSSMGFKIT